jgi:GNAT superfamily N-acetyltransferase
MDDALMEPEIMALTADHMQAAAAIRRVALWQRLPWLPDVHTPEEEEQYWRMHLLPNCSILGATLGNQLVGVIAYGDNWIEQLYVLPGFQGRGIGSSLLGCAKAEMNEIRLWTLSVMQALVLSTNGIVLPLKRRPMAPTTKSGSLMCSIIGAGFRS